MTVIAEILRKSPFFSELSEDELAEVASCVQERTFRRGEVILLKGEALRQCTLSFMVRCGFTASRWRVVSRC